MSAWIYLEQTLIFMLMLLTKKEETMQDKQNKLTPKQNPESHFLNGKPSMIFFINRSGKNTKKQKDC